MMERGRGDGPNLETRQDGTANAILTPNGGRGGLGVGAIAFAQNQRDEVRQMEVAGALAAEPGMKQQTYVAFSSKDYGADATNDVAPTLRAMGHADSHPNAGGQMAVAFNPKAGGNKTIGKSYLDDGSAYTLDTNCTSVAIQQEWAVRRLTPMECERLQGFKDNYTLVPYRNKPAADGPRYKALGNSMAVNVMRIIGERIAMVDAMEVAA